MDGSEVVKSQNEAIQQRSAPTGTTSEELVKYVLVELDVARQHHDEFQKRMPELVELMFDHVRWELVFASYPITGVVSRFVHIWKIPDESTLVEVMREGAVKLTRAEQPNPDTLDAAFRACYLRVQDLIERTSHTLMTSLPYDPTNVGFQSQTILLDAEGEAFIIEHSKLRAAVGQPGFEGLQDISDDLEQIRRSKFKRLDRETKEQPRHKDPLPPPKQPMQIKPPRTDLLMRLQEHLNRGSAVARLKVEGGDALLFNLAGLKARSVFQAVKAEPFAGGPGLKLPAGNGEVDTPVKRLFIAMPWGGVYDVDHGALEKLVQPIPKDRRGATATALEPIASGSVPIASIPTERDNVIGDGCACYVINLKSFR